MKKIYLILVILLLTTACTGSYLKNLNFKNLNKKLDNKETFILYLSAEDDGSKTLKNTLKEVLKKHKLTGYTLNTEKLSDKDLQSLKQKFNFENSNFIIFVNKGVEETVLARITDVYISTTDLENELKLQGFIK